MATAWAVVAARSERVNRAVNFVLAASALTFLSPLLLLIALAIKLTSRGPILSPRSAWDGTIASIATDDSAASAGPGAIVEPASTVEGASSGVRR